MKGLFQRVLAPGVDAAPDPESTPGRPRAIRTTASPLVAFRVRLGRVGGGAAWVDGLGHGRYHPGMPTSQEIRVIVRAELRRLLAHAVDSFPPDPSPSSDSANPGLDGALDAWEALGGGERPLTVGEAMAAGRGIYTPHRDAWEALCEAMGLEEGARDGRCVGKALARARGRRDGLGRVLVATMDRTRKVRRWRVARAGVGERVLGRSSEEPSSPAPLPRCLWCEDRIDMYGHSARHTLSSASPGVRVWRRVEDRREEVKVGERIACGEALEVEDGGAGGGIGIGTAYG